MARSALLFAWSFVLVLGSAGCYSHSERSNNSGASGSSKPRPIANADSAANATAGAGGGDRGPNPKPGDSDRPHGTDPDAEQLPVATAGAGTAGAGTAGAGIAGAGIAGAGAAGMATPPRMTAGVDGAPPPGSQDLSDSDGRGTDILDCDIAAGYRVIRYKTGRVGTPEVHVLGVYETGRGRRQAIVKVTRDVPVALVLSAYEPTHWTVLADADARIETVVLNGLNRQTVAISTDTEILDYSGTQSGNQPLADCAYGERGDCDTPALLAGAERVLGQPVAAFAGCYDASTFVVGNED